MAEPVVVFGRIPDVPICETGTWPTSTGEFTFTTTDLASAVKAVADCPAVRSPALILGHTDMAGTATNGLPAVGWLGNLRVEHDGHTLVGDYEGMPEWLAAAAPSAYPDRSIEGAYGFRCTLGHTHDFVITAVALLGAERPAVGTLTSLQDIAALYGVTAASTPGPDARVFTTTPKAGPMPTPVLATTSADDIRRAFYSGAEWSQWIREIDVDPAQLIVEDDDGDALVRIPYTISGDAITFGEPVPVVTEYRDKTVTAQVAEIGPRTIRAAYADRAHSRPGSKPTAAEAPVSTPAAPGGISTEDTPMSTLSDGLRTALGLDPAADEATILAATQEALTERATPVPAALPDGAVLVDAAALTELRASAELGRQAHARQAETDRDTAIRAAVDTGRIPPARVEHFRAAWAADSEGTRTVLAALAPGLIPLVELGEVGDGQTATDQQIDSEYARLFPPSLTQEV